MQPVLEPHRTKTKGKREALIPCRRLPSAYHLHVWFLTYDPIHSRLTVMEQILTGSAEIVHRPPPHISTMNTINKTKRIAGYLGLLDDI